MEFRKMLMITLYAEQKKRHRCIEQSFRLWEKARVGCFKRTASKRILSRVKQITSPGWMHETSARTWCTGKTQRDRVEREVGVGGIGMGNTCKPMAVSFQCMTKSTTIIIIIKEKRGKKRRQVGGGTSLAVQWLGLHASTAGAWVWPLVEELAGPKKKHRWVDG